MGFADIFWPAFWAMMASGVAFELFHLGMRLFVGWRAMKREIEVREQIAEKMGVDPEQLDVMADMYGGGGGFPMNPQGFPPVEMMRPAPTVSGNTEEDNKGHGQYL